MYRATKFRDPVVTQMTKELNLTIQEILRDCGGFVAGRSVTEFEELSRLRQVYTTSALDIYFTTKEGHDEAVRRLKARESFVLKDMTTDAIQFEQLQNKEQWCLYRVFTFHHRPTTVNDFMDNAVLNVDRSVIEYDPILDTIAVTVANPTNEISLCNNNTSSLSILDPHYFISTLFFGTKGISAGKSISLAVYDAAIAAECHRRGCDKPPKATNAYIMYSNQLTNGVNFCRGEGVGLIPTLHELAHLTDGITDLPSFDRALFSELSETINDLEIDLTELPHLVNPALRGFFGQMATIFPHLPKSTIDGLISLLGRGEPCITPALTALVFYEVFSVALQQDQLTHLDFFFAEISKYEQRMSLDQWLDYTRSDYFELDTPAIFYQPLYGFTAELKLNP